MGGEEIRLHRRGESGHGNGNRNLKTEETRREMGREGKQMDKESEAFLWTQDESRATAAASIFLNKCNLNFNFVG